MSTDEDYDSEGEEDAWYARMESAALQEELPEVVDQQNLGSGQLDDSKDDYFDRLQYHATNAPHDMFVDETHGLWQSVLRNMVSDGEPSSKVMARLLASNGPEIMLVRQWLFSYLPMSLVIYNLVDAEVLASNPGRQLYVDHKMHPSLAFTYLYKEGPCVLYVNMFTTHQVSVQVHQSMMSWLYQVARGIDSCKCIRLVATEVSLFEHLFGQDKRFHTEWIENCGLFVLDSSKAATQNLSDVASALPENYEFSDLR